MPVTITYPRTLYRSHALTNSWIQLLILVTLGVLAPSAIWFKGSLSSLMQPPALNALCLATIAVILTWHILNKLRYFAKSRQISYVVPVNAATFGMVFSALIFLRLPYSIFVLGSTFFTVTVTSFVVIALSRKSFGEQWLIPGGRVTEVVSSLQDYSFLTKEKFRVLLEGPVKPLSIIADLHYDHDGDWEELVAEAAIRGMGVYHYRQILESQTGQVKIENLRENNFGSLVPNLAYTGFKRAIDIMSSALIIPILTPIFIIVAIIIKIDSRGPVFFSQERMGYRGRSFQMHKFRSMKVRDAPASENEKVADAITRDNDERITTWGRFIRRYRIDELPQIFNVLMGDMSWIGPRPEAESLSQMYQKNIPFYRYRHIVRPGITGWAQVNQGHVAAISDVSEKLRYDFYYVRHISLWLDILICLKTLRIIIFGFGAK